MTDNTPRPEPMSRESVLTVLESAMRYPPSIEDLMKVRSAVAALYERCEALERAVERKDGALRLYCNLGPCPASDHELRQALACNGDVTMDDVVRPLGHPSDYTYTGTEPSDAEGGG